MCGIFGLITKSDSGYNVEFLNTSFKELAKLSESRGKDSSGICNFNQTNSTIDVLKGPIPISNLIRSRDFEAQLSSTFIKGETSRYAFGHARLVTNGTQLNDENNQPVIKDGIVAVHNGIISNVDKLWRKYKSIKREFEIDTEVLLSLIRNNLNQNKSLEESVSLAVNESYGTVAIALVINDINQFILATNNGSLYVLHNQNDILYFASELYMLKEFAKKTKLSRIGQYEVSQIKSNKGIRIDLNNFSINNFNLTNSISTNDIETVQSKYPININSIKDNKKQMSTVIDLNLIHLSSKSESEKKLLIYPVEKILSLKRCSKCLLPETFPYIYYDNFGECNYCKNYIKKEKPKNISELKKLVDPYRKSNGLPEVLIPLSGGRDSTYVLHLAKKELGLNPIAFTYDWGMVTDLARRNIARICGELGVENIIVAADIHWKRENIRKNITTWLKNPELGMIPLFMAGDKFFFYYAHKIKKQLNIDLEIWGVNELENTNFKTGFAGLKPQFDKKRIYSISFLNQLKLFGFVSKNIICSPGYINQSILDSLGSIASRYITPKSNYYHLFDYMQWDETIVENTIINNYNWEKAVDTDSTWRIGDGTASFYNYIYTLVAGFSENDTFRSNQIREGMITREKGLQLIQEENKPRYNSIKWYLEIIGLDYDNTIKRINKMPRIY